MCVRSPLSSSGDGRRVMATVFTGLKYIGDMTTVDLLAIAAHRDDVELTCAGTLIKAAKQGYKTAILDFTQGEMGSRGSIAIRAAEASKAAETMGVAARENLGLP